MAILGLIEYEDASPEVRAVYDDIMATRKIDWINNFWKALANDPSTLKRTWNDIKEIMGPGALDPLTRELIYVAVSVSNQCGYCIASHTASAKKKGMTDEMFKELMSVVGMANETNRLSAGTRWKSTTSLRNKYYDLKIYDLVPRRLNCDFSLLQETCGTRDGTGERRPTYCRAGYRDEFNCDHCQAHGGKYAFTLD
jgi:AhpD family alkylhydroperoxidase